MVGDGLNDAPSLASAHVSLSPISAADLTQAQADAVFLGERLQPVLDAVRIGSRARSLMTENLWFAAIYNAVAVPIAIAGAVTPLIAALAMSGSSLLVTLNALRALAGQRPATCLSISCQWPWGLDCSDSLPFCGPYAVASTVTSTGRRGACSRTMICRNRLIPCPGTFPSKSWPGYFCKAIYAARSAASLRDRRMSGMRGCGASRK